MNRLLGTSVVGGVGVGRMRCRPSQYSPFARMVKLVKARSSDDCKICCGGGALDGDYKEVDFGSIFSLEEKAQKMAGHPKELHYGSVFTGELEKRYLDYLQKLDWFSMSTHIADFPRGRSRSQDEMRVIFDKWTAYYGRNFDDRSKEVKFLVIKKKLAGIDAHNSTDKSWQIGLNAWSGKGRVVCNVAY